MLLKKDEMILILIHKKEQIRKEMQLHKNSTELTLSSAASINVSRRS